MAIFLILVLFLGSKCKGKHLFFRRKDVRLGWKCNEWGVLTCFFMLVDAMHYPHVDSG